LRLYLDLWTLYDRPRDFPRHIVARRHRVERGRRDPVPAPVACLYDSVEEARWDMEQLGLGGPLPRDADDEPQIIETWL